MTAIVGRMIEAARANPGWRAAEKLTDADRGWRLSAYLYLYSHPDFAQFQALVESACRFADDNRQFGVYWSLLALRRVLAAGPGEAVGAAERSLLEKLAWKFEAGTDREAEMRLLLASLKQTPLK